MARLLKWGTKFGIVGASVYYTNESGLWSDSANTEQLYKDLYSAVSPLLEDVPVEVPEIPKAGEISRSIVDGWNAGVLHSATFLANLPTHAYNAGVMANDWLSDQTKAPAPSS
ncbi:hypothetical protein GE061_017702 [Apolygus lucorum]|uniref:MICOS complex subunit MIC13 n=1 Tax=Apolygus lucorum TaxID=248454 RepID=A0A6A4IUT7_APOLU|nr:hypothetical protein GE061_017702 [Apolygus lucorum]